MKLTTKDLGRALGKYDLLVAFAPEGKAPKLPAGVRAPAAALADFRGEFRQSVSTHLSGKDVARLLLVGLGDEKGLDAERLRRAAALAAKSAESAGCAKATFLLSAPLAKAVGGARVAGEALAEGALMGAYRFDTHKSDSKPAKLQRVCLAGPGAEFSAGARRGVLAAEANAFTRDLQNAPANRMTPRDMATRARTIARKSERVSCTVLDEKAMERLGMGSLLSVSKGSDEPARLIHLRYRPKGKARGKVALVGKGLTFDAGGISIKPAAGMDEMKYDMSGGAAVLGVFHALASGAQVPHEVHGVVACSENLINGKANKPGDVVRAMNGTTIEVLNTDAEGRLILADALSYVDTKVKPDTVIDLATLTGAVIMALGHELTGMFASTDELREQLTAAGRATGELVWALPLLELHKEQMKGKVADLKNINNRPLGNGSTAGAAFLSRFAGEREWCHLDIAGTAWNQAERDYVGGADGTGVGVRLLLSYLENRKK